MASGKFTVTLAGYEIVEYDGAKVDLVVAGTRTDPVPAVLNRAPEDCSPFEPAEFHVMQICDKAGIPLPDYVTDRLINDEQFLDSVEKRFESEAVAR